MTTMWSTLLFNRTTTLFFIGVDRCDLREGRSMDTSHQLAMVAFSVSLWMFRGSVASEGRQQPGTQRMLLVVDSSVITLLPFCSLLLSTFQHYPHIKISPRHHHRDGLLQSISPIGRLCKVPAAASLFFVLGRGLFFFWNWVGARRQPP